MSYNKSLDLALLEILGVPVSNVQTSIDAPEWYHPGKSGALCLGPKVLAYFGDIHPTALRKLDAQEPIVGFEVFLDSVPNSRSKGPNRSLLKLEPLQPVNRDFAFIVDTSVPAEKLVRAVQGADRKLISAVAVFDNYLGKGVPEGKKSLAIAVTLQPSGGSLTEDVLENVSTKIVNQVKKNVAGQLRE